MTARKLIGNFFFVLGVIAFLAIVLPSTPSNPQLDQLQLQLDELNKQLAQGN